MVNGGEPMGGWQHYAEGLERRVAEVARERDAAQRALDGTRTAVLLALEQVPTAASWADTGRQLIGRTDAVAAVRGAMLEEVEDPHG